MPNIQVTPQNGQEEPPYTMHQRTMDVQPTGSQLSNIEADILQTISLGGTIVTLVKEPIALLYSNIQKKQVLKRSLGLWQREAYEHGELHIPQLCQDDFETYLNQHIGILEATGEYQAGASWGYLLYALGVRPGMNTVRWKPVLSASIFTQNGGIEMEIDGAVICHIMNLYRAETDWNSFKSRSYPYKRAEDTEQCQLSFGYLAWTNRGDQVHAHFKPGSLSTLREPKRPFGTVGRGMEPYTHMISYFNTLEYGVSNPRFRLPHHSAPIQERTKQLIKFFDWLADIQLFYSGLKPSTSPTPLLISWDWVAQASRIKRRLLARGGHDQTFYQLICEHVDSHPKMVTADRTVREDLKDEMFRLFLFGNASFQVQLQGSSEASTNSYPVNPPIVVREALESLQTEPVGSWNHELYVMKEEVIRVLFANNIIFLDQYIARHLLILDFTKQSSLWSQPVLCG
jgi:hypothetical protein